MLTPEQQAERQKMYGDNPSPEDLRIKKLFDELYGLVDTLAKTDTELLADSQEK